MLCKVQKEPRFGDVAHQDKLNLEVLDVNAMQVHDGGGGCNQGRLCHTLCRVCRLCGLKDAYRARAATGKVINPPPPQIGEQIGGPFFRQNRNPVPWISVPGPKHTFLMVAQ